jgi:hypothetical protein
MLCSLPMVLSFFPSLLFIDVDGIFAADEKLRTLQRGCFKYFQMGGQCIDGPVGLLAGFVPNVLCDFLEATDWFCLQNNPSTLRTVLPLFRGGLLFDLHFVRIPLASELADSVLWLVWRLLQGLCGHLSLHLLRD